MSLWLRVEINSLPYSALTISVKSIVFSTLLVYHGTNCHCECVSVTVSHCTMRPQHAVIFADLYSPCVRERVRGERRKTRLKLASENCTEQPPELWASLRARWWSKCSRCFYNWYEHIVKREMNNFWQIHLALPLFPAHCSFSPVATVHPLSA